jgi:hypothetical protein
MKVGLSLLLTLSLLAANSFGQNDEKLKSSDRAQKTEERDQPRKDQKREGRDQPPKDPKVFDKHDREPRTRRKDAQIGISQPTPPQNAFAAAAGEIGRLRPDIDHEALKCDEDVVRTSLPEIQKVYAESGFTKEDAQGTALTAWKEVRLTSPLKPDKCMAAASYTAFALSLGTLVFKSNPDDADIIIVNSTISAKTIYRRLFEAGIKRRVRFSKKGFETVEIECTAVERASTDCYAELKPIP